ncbi:hypothetical protein DM01DRAFT_1339863 [Hesseltinella vesiculosa]|uniref:SGNH hydrolase n=1 Tax=Hesseltinella vesiculosa TaxID=101127 RepID=A0A1X2G602_9FUNG|nr:hypothetical protein DM01DRAFT_1339863 [Hesseltinella vesiculosa]
MLLLILCTLVLLSTLASALVKNIVVFGDDYSDVGTGHRYSNGPLWSQQLAVGWDASLHSFAFSGSVCNASSSVSIVDQAEMYYQQHLELDPQYTIYAFWVGHADVQAKMLANDTNYEDTLDCIMDQMRTVRKVFKTDRFLMFTLAPMDLMPGALALSKKEQQRIKQAVDSFNEQLHEKVFAQVKHHHLLELDLVDAHDLLVEVIQRPEDYGFKNGQDAFWDHCQGRCNDKEDDYIWWDKQHLTGNAHHIIAKSILMSDSMEPSVNLPFLDQVRTKVDQPHSIFHSPLYHKPHTHTGLLDRLVQQINDAKKQQDKEITADDNEQTAVDAEEGFWLQPLYWMALVTIVVCIGFVLCGKQMQRRRMTGGLAALSGLVNQKRHQDTSTRGQFTRLRQLDTSV